MSHTTRPPDTTPGPFHDLPPAPVLPGYEVLEELGRGGMGVVYKARQTALKRLVALKMILHADHAGREARQRFRAEAEAVARLQHPNIVQVHEIGEHGGAPFFSLELCPGGSLSRKLAGSPQPPRAAAELVETLARAVHAAHQAGVVHRDLKPANVLLGADGTPKVADFGLAKCLDSDSAQTRTGAVLGTPSYMAPEQAAGKVHELGPAADVYALGAILYECLTGRPPFRGATAAETLEMVRRQPPVPPRRLGLKVPRDLETVCLKCLEKEPRQRYAGAEELADDLRRFRNTEPIRARRVGPAGRAWRWCRRRPLPAALLALAAAVLLGLAVYWPTRAAYLDLLVTPPGAAVTLDGEALPLTEGRARVTRSPGRHLLRVKAAGYADHEQTVELRRGRGNAAEAVVELVSDRGWLKVDTAPDGARVEVVRGGAVIALGTTPCTFQLPAGDCLVRCIKDQYGPQEIAVALPNADRTASVGPLILRLLDGATDSARLFQLMKQLQSPWKGQAEIDDPGMILKELLAYVSDRMNLPLTVNENAFRAEMLGDVLNLRVCPPPIRLAGERLSTGDVLRAILARVPAESGAVVSPKKSKSGFYLEVTTGADADEERLLLLHPVRDLTTGDDPVSGASLVKAVYQTVRRPQQVRMGYMEGPKVIQVEAPWRAQEAIDAYLTQLRKAGRAGNAAPPGKAPGGP